VAEVRVLNVSRILTQDPKNEEEKYPIEYDVSADLFKKKRNVLFVILEDR